ncbi:MAG: tetratricopeptide repeat protein [Phycisphaerales bacterium]|nr:MAG: tetratricopeptide repeat protein [Phycisphaerales bacterium]
MLLCSCALVPGCLFLPPQTDYARFTSEQLNDFGVVYEQAGNFREAERAYKKALAKDTANYIAASNLANIYCHNRKWDKAIRYYQMALTVCPDYVPALNNLANIQIETRDYTGAEENLQKALVLAQTPEEKRAVYLSFASLNRSMGGEEESEKWTQKAQSLKPSTVISGVPFFKQKQYDCGPAALACVYNFLGVKQDPEEISQRLYNREHKGSLNLKLLIDAREQGLEATMYSGSFEHIRQAIDNEVPLILMLSEDEDSMHYVVAVGYEGDNLSTIIVHDGYEAFKQQSRQALEQKWSATGYCTIEMREAR